MPWLLIIQFLVNFPSFVKTVKEIIALIRSLGGDEKSEYEDRLKSVLRRCNNGKCVQTSDADEFERLKEELKSKVK